MFRRKQLSEKLKGKQGKKGVASLIVTVAFALLFVVLVVALTALSLREQRQASDTDQSNRAFAAAEAGIKDALSRLDKNSNYSQDSCDSQNLGGDTQYGWTCLTVTQKPGDIESQADKDESKSAYVFMSGQPVSAGGGGDTKAWADHLNFYWSRKMSGDKGPASSVPSPIYPSFSGGTWDRPAGVELTFVYWKAGNPAIPTDISVGSGSFDTNKSLMTKTYFIMPSTNGSITADASLAHTSNTISSKCSNSLSGPTGRIEYYCKLVQGGTDGIDLSTVFGDPGNASKYRFVFKLKPRYSSTNYYAAFSAGGIANKVLVPATSAIIDVTARSGNVYRRIRAERSLETRARGTVFDSAVFSGTDICKNLTVDSSNNTKTYNSCD